MNLCQWIINDQDVLQSLLVNSQHGEVDGRYIAHGDPVKLPFFMRPLMFGIPQNMRNDELLEPVNCCYRLKILKEENGDVVFSEKDKQHTVLALFGEYISCVTQLIEALSAEFKWVGVDLHDGALVFFSSLPMQTQLNRTRTLSLTQVGSELLLFERGLYSGGFEIHYV